MFKYATLARVWSLLPFLLLAGCVIRPPQIPNLEQLPPEQAELVQVEAAAKGLTPDQLLLLAQLPSKGIAPELSNEVWLNTEGYGGGPLQLADLRGKVVIVEFWTYG